MNYVTLSRQEMNLPFTTGSTYSNNSVLFTQTSSMVLGKNLLSLTVLTNQSDNKSYYFNTSMFSSEVNYSYPLSGTIRMSSVPGYYSNAGWNRQIGLRQQVSAMINGKLSMDLQLGYKKAVKVIRTELADQLFLSTTMRYSFK